MKDDMMCGVCGTHGRYEKADRILAGKPEVKKDHLIDLDVDSKTDQKQDMSMWTQFMWIGTDQWRALVWSVINIRIQQKERTFLTSCANISFPSALLHDD
jgi:hypothetical protein